jgi:hypothetical protein
MAAAVNPTRMLGAWLLFVAGSRAEVVDRIVRVVGTRLLTQSDLAFEQALAPHDTSPVPAFEDPGADVLQRLVDCAIARDQAGNIERFKPAPEEVRERWLAFRAALGPVEYPRFLATWGLDDTTLQAFLYSRLVVEKYILRGMAGIEVAGGATSAYETLMRPLRERAVVRAPR